MNAGKCARLAVFLGASCIAAVVAAQTSPGVTQTTIKLGQTMPYSGPASAFGVIGRAETAYFKMINAAGGINGRRVDLLSMDDGFSPPKTVEATRKLVEDDQVLAIVGSMGTAPNLAVTKYLNAKGVPQILVATSTDKMNDPKNLPWTTSFFQSQSDEARIYAKFLLRTRPDAKVGVLFQNDDYGKGFLTSLKSALGAKAATMIVKEVSYDLSDPTVDSQVIDLKASGADTFIQAASPKFGAQAIRKAYDIGWKPYQIIATAMSSIASTLQPAGLEKSVGVVSAIHLKNPGDPAWRDDPAMKEYMAFAKTWASDLNPEDTSVVQGYSVAQLATEVLRRCGNDLSRENVIKQATSIKDFQLPLFVPGVKINVSPENRVAWRQSRLAKFDGTYWVFFGDVISAAD